MNGASRAAAARIVVTPEENEQRQLGHMDRMKAVMADDASRAYTLSLMHQRYQTYVRNLLRPNPGAVLDIGCGFADVWFGYLRDLGFVHYGLDMNDEVVAHMTRLLKQQGDGVFARKGHIESLPFADRSFDVVYASHILEHTIDIGRAMGEITRVLKADGYLVFAVPCGYDEEPAHTYNREREEWIQDFTDHGFAIEASGQFDFCLNEFHGRAVPIGH